MKKAKYENICILDADCMLKDRAIETALNHFKDPKVVAVGGRIQVINETHSWIEIMQQCEYMATFQIARSIFAKLNAQCLISGAFGIFRKSALLEIGGYDTNTVGEDMELVLRLQDGGKVRPQNKLVYEKNAVCYTCVPQDIFRLLHQRDRWQRGLLDSLIKHRHMIADLNYGFLGLALLYQLLFELLGPVIVLVFVSVPFLRALIPEPLPLFIAYVTGKTLVTLFAAYLEEEKNFTNVVKRAPVLVLGTILIIALQIVLIFVRLFGMITFPKRKLVW